MPKPLQQINDPNSLSYKTRLYDNTWSKPNRIFSVLRVPEGEAFKKLSIIQDDARKRMIELARAFWPKLYSKAFHQTEHCIGFLAAEQQIWRNTPRGANGVTAYMREKASFTSRFNITWAEFLRVLDNMTAIANTVANPGINRAYGRISKLDALLEVGQEFFCATEVPGMARKIRKWRDDYKEEAEKMWLDIHGLHKYVGRRRQADWDRMMWQLSFYHRFSLRLIGIWQQNLPTEKTKYPDNWIWQEQIPPELAQVVRAMRRWRDRKHLSRTAQHTALLDSDPESDDGGNDNDWPRPGGGGPFEPPDDDDDDGGDVPPQYGSQRDTPDPEDLEGEDGNEWPRNTTNRNEDFNMDITLTSIPSNTSSRPRAQSSFTTNSSRPSGSTKSTSAAVPMPNQSYGYYDDVINPPTISAHLSSNLSPAVSAQLFSKSPAGPSNLFTGKSHAIPANHLGMYNTSTAFRGARAPPQPTVQLDLTNATTAGLPDEISGDTVTQKTSKIVQDVYNITKNAAIDIVAGAITEPSKPKKDNTYGGVIGQAHFQYTMAGTRLDEEGGISAGAAAKRGNNDADAEGPSKKRGRVAVKSGATEKIRKVVHEDSDFTAGSAVHHSYELRDRSRLRSVEIQ